MSGPRLDADQCSAIAKPERSFLVCWDSGRMGFISLVRLVYQPVPLPELETVDVIASPKAHPFG